METIREIIYNVLEKEVDAEINGIKVWELFKDNGESVYFDITTIDDIDDNDSRSVLFTLVGDNDSRSVLFTLVGDDEYGKSYHVTVELDIIKRKVMDWYDIDRC